MGVDCLFCFIAAGEKPAFTVYAGSSVLAFLDIRPVFKGHVLVIPREHIEVLTDLTATGPFFDEVKAAALAVQTSLGAQGTFVAINNRVSQSVPHLHAHVVPRTKGDGLKGFFWPRTKYASDGEAASYAEKIGAAWPS